jgi:pyruvate carboxylase
MHRYKADESFQIAKQGELTPVGAYLAIDKIVDIAIKRGLLLYLVNRRQCDSSWIRILV